MTYRTDKQGLPGEEGITLMLAILILSAITAIAFSLASIIFIEIRASGDVMRTEPALYAAQSVTEEAFYQYKRYVPEEKMSVTKCEPVALRVCGLPDIAVDMSGTKPVERKFDVSPRIDTVLPNITRTYLFVDPENPNSYEQAYSEIGVKNLDNGYNAELEVRLDKFDETGGASFPAPIDETIYPGGPQASYAIPRGDTGQYQLTVRNASMDKSALAQISATDIDGRRQLPLVGRKVIDITAAYLGLTRKYTVEIPLP